MVGDGHSYRKLGNHGVRTGAQRVGELTRKQIMHTHVHGSSRHGAIARQASVATIWSLIADRFIPTCQAVPAGRVCLGFFWEIGAGNQLGQATPGPANNTASPRGLTRPRAGHGFVYRQVRGKVALGLTLLTLMMLQSTVVRSAVIRRRLLTSACLCLQVSLVQVSGSVWNIKRAPYMLLGIMEDTLLAQLDTTTDPGWPCTWSPLTANAQTIQRQAPIDANQFLGDSYAVALLCSVTLMIAKWPSHARAPPSMIPRATHARLRRSIMSSAQCLVLNV